MISHILLCSPILLRRSPTFCHQISFALLQTFHDTQHTDCAFNQTVWSVLEKVFSEQPRFKTRRHHQCRAEGSTEPFVYRDQMHSYCLELIAQLKENLFRYKSTTIATILLNYICPSDLSNDTSPYQATNRGDIPTAPARKILCPWRSLIESPRAFMACKSAEAKHPPKERHINDIPSHFD